MNLPSGCPDKSVLSALLEGSLPGPDAALVSGHLDSCATCQGTIEELADGVNLLEDIGHNLGGKQDPDSSRLQRVVDDLRDPNRTLGGQRDQTNFSEMAQDRTELRGLRPPSHPDQIGRLGDYEVFKVAGRGGMGTVLLARDPTLNRQVAIKVLASHLARNDTARKRFLREARSAAAISHPNVVTILNVAETDDPHGSGIQVPILVMEFVDGETLADRIKREGRLDMRMVIRIGAQIASGLAEAHAQGVIHRDIKPSNILLGRNSTRTKITDFGLARAANDATITRSGVLAGTPAYMSPEQTQGLAVDDRSDLFSLGSLLYAMCTGDSPFNDRSTIASIDRVYRETPVPLRNLNSEVPPWLEKLVSTLHAKQPNRRIQTATEVQRTLRKNYREGSTVKQTPATRANRIGWKSIESIARGHWSIAAMVIAVVALLGGALAISDRQTNESADVTGNTADAPSKQTIAHSQQPHPEPLPRGGNAGNPAGKTAPPPDQQNTFLVRVKDGPDRHYDHLDQAIRGAPTGAEILIHSPGPHLISPFELQDHELSIRAVHPDYAVIKPNQPALVGPLVSLINSRLELNGISIERDPLPEDDNLVRPNSLVVCMQGQLVAKHCRFRADNGIALVLHHPQECDLASCEIYTMNGIAVQWSFQRGSRLAIRNCLLLADTAIQQHFLPDLTDIMLEMHENTFVSWYLMQLSPNSPLAGSRRNNPGPPPGNQPHSMFTSRATRNVFDVGHSIIDIRHGDNRKKTPRSFRMNEISLKTTWDLLWTANLYSEEARENGFISTSSPVAGRPGPISAAAPTRPPWSPLDLAGWCRFWNCELRDSAVRKLIYVDGRSAIDLEKLAQQTPTQLHPTLFRLAFENGREQVRYGIHYDRVGRGPRQAPGPGSVSPVDPLPPAANDPSVPRSSQP